MRSIFSIAALVLLIDQFCKFWVVNSLQLLEIAFSVGGIFEITRAHNTGMAFSLFAGKPLVMKLVVTFIVILLLIYICQQDHKDLLQNLAYAFILGGAASNLLDRYIYSHVIDYINLLFIDFPIFNLADSMLNIGAGLILFSLLRKETR